VLTQAHADVHGNGPRVSSVAHRERERERARERGEKRESSLFPAAYLG